MLKQSSAHIFPIERLVFVCKNLDQHFENKQWEKFSLSPLRKTRGYLQSRYVIFKNLMLEFLELTDIEEGHKFAFFEDWKISNQPLWVGIGLKVDDLESTLSLCQKYHKNVAELFFKESSEYAKGFAHKSALMDFSIQNRSIYFTEYDKQFEDTRNHRLFVSDKKRDNFPELEICPIDLSKGNAQTVISIDGLNRVCLKIKKYSSINYSFDTDWIICK